MVAVTFTFTPPKIDHAKIPQAIARGLNEGGDKVRTRVQRALKVQTNVKSYRSITSRVRTIRAFPGGLHYELVTPSRPIPLTEFPVAVKTGAGGGVDAKTWGVDHLFARSFAKGQGYMARRGLARFPIHRLLGPNLAKEMHRGDIPSLFASASAEFVPPAVLKHIVRALG